MSAAGYQTTTAVLFVAFTRRDLAIRSFAAVRAVRPPRIHLALDGPRAAVPADVPALAQTRAALAAMIDWPCEVHWDEAAENLGCGRRVSSAISRAFDREERLIIIEDDCLADPTFFRFCDELLERHAADERIAMISGDQFAPGGWTAPATSYRFAQLAQVWGWATWRRAWSNFDYELRTLDERAARRLLRATFRRAADRRYWLSNYRQAPHIDCWDFQWCFNRWQHRQLGIVPAHNLVTNLGFGAEASHTKAAHHPVANLPAIPMAFPLRHPPEVAVDDDLDRESARMLFCSDLRAWWHYQRDQRLARWLPWLFPRTRR